MDSLWKKERKDFSFCVYKTIAAYLSYFSTTGYCKCLMVQKTLWNAFCFEVLYGCSLIERKNVFSTNWRINGDYCQMLNRSNTYELNVLYSFYRTRRPHTTMLFWFLAKFLISLWTRATQMEEKRNTWLKYLKKTM